ncbi:hypothetical protein HGB13_04135 [bacterium]|nr:hypothetical protein [bacterium]
MSKPNFRNRIRIKIEKLLDNFDYWKKANVVILLLISVITVLLSFYNINYWSSLLMFIVVLGNFIASFVKNNFVKELSSFMTALFSVSAFVVLFFSTIIYFFVAW